MHVKMRFSASRQQSTFLGYVMENVFARFMVRWLHIFMIACRKIQAKDSMNELLLPLTIALSLSLSLSLGHCKDRYAFGLQFLLTFAVLMVPGWVQYSSQRVPSLSKVHCNSIIQTFIMVLKSYTLQRLFLSTFSSLCRYFQFEEKYPSFWYNTFHLVPITVCLLLLMLQRWLH